MAGMIPDEFVEKEMSDVDFARWCKSNGWKGEFKHLNTKGSIVYTQYTVENKVLCVVKIKNDAPVDRWLFLNPEFIK